MFFSLQWHGKKARPLLVPNIVLYPNIIIHLTEEPVKPRKWSEKILAVSSLGLIEGKCLVGLNSPSFITNYYVQIKMFSIIIIFIYQTTTTDLFKTVLNHKVKYFK